MGQFDAAQQKYFSHISQTQLVTQPVEYHQVGVKQTFVTPGARLPFSEV
jgi:hypothetical protein